MITSTFTGLPQVIRRLSKVVLVLTYIVIAGPRVSYATTVPAFEGTRLNGEKYAFDPNTINKPYLFVFWASWCEQCRYEIPELLDLYREKGKQVEIVGISVDEKLEDAKRIAREASMPYINVIDSNAKLAGKFGVDQTPALVLVAANGRVVGTSHRLSKLEQDIDRVAPSEHRFAEVGLSHLVVKDDVSFVEHETTIMGTPVYILIESDDEKGAQTAIRAAVDEMKRIEAIMTDWSSDSVLMKLNRNAGKSPVAVGDDLYAMLLEGVRLGDVTKGAFDISYAAVGSLWDFSKRDNAPPSAEAIASKLPLVNYKGIELESETRAARLEKTGMRLGLGGIAKGYAVDRAAQKIKALGFKNFAVNAGGDLTVRGRVGRKARLWWVSIQHPRKKNETIAVIPATNVSVVTSGDSERYFEYQGKRYAHILDPKTGYPADQCQSVTIVAKRAYEADALATGVFVLGPEKGMKLIESLKNVEGVIVAHNGSVTVSSGLESHGKNVQR